MACGLFRATAVHDQDAAVIRRKPEDDLAGEGIIGAEYRGSQTTLAAPGERDRVVGVAVRHYRRHGTKGLDRVDGARRGRIAGEQQERRHKRAARAVGALYLELLQVTRAQVGLTAQFGDASQDVAPLF